MAEECDCRGCCRYPHGRISIFASIFAILSYILSANAVWTCQYAQTGDNVGVGLLSREELFTNDDDFNCKEWESELIDEFDSYWRAARALGITALVIGGISMVAMIATACMSFQMVYFTILKFSMALTGLLVILTLLALNSDICERISEGSSCEFHTGAGLAIGGSVCSWITAVLIHKIPPAAEDPRDAAAAVASPVQAAPPGSSAPPGTITVTEKTFPDGTKKIIKTTVNADGSKTVEETVMAPVP